MKNQKLASPWILIKHSFELFLKKENLFYLTKLNLLGLLVSMAVLSPLFLLGFYGENLQNLGGAIYVLFVVSLISLVAGLIWGIWFQTTGIKAVANVVDGDIIGVKETFRLAWPRVGKFAIMALAVGLLFIGGLILLIIPGILVFVWYFFTNYIIVTENVGVREALRKSKALVSGYFWQVLGRISVLVLFYIIIQIVLSLVPVVGPLVLILSSPYYILLPYLIFEELKRVKGEGISSAGEAGSQVVGE